MSTTTARQKLFDDTDDLQRTLDELRVQAHLAGAESQEHWKNAQEAFKELQGVIGQLKTSAREPLADMTAAAERLLREVGVAIEKLRC